MPPSLLNPLSCGTAISLDLLFLPLVSADASSKSAEWWFPYSGLRGWSSKGHISKQFFTSIKLTLRAILGRNQFRPN